MPTRLTHKLQPSQKKHLPASFIQVSYLPGPGQHLGLQLTN